MICHGELYRLKPPAAYLTKYYLYISAGGALGGLLVAVVAPAVFDHYVELQIGLGLLMYLLGTMCILHQSRSIAIGAAAGTLLALIAVPALFATKIVGTHGWSRALVAEFKVFYQMYGWWAAAVVVLVFWGLLGRGRWWPREWQLRMAAGPMALAFVAGVFFVVQIGDESGRNVEASRNFYGTLTVMERKREDERLRYYALTHGNITHGLQFAEAPLNRLITSYYGESSGVGRAIASVPSLGGKRIGVVGLGTGTLATYGEVGDRLRFYEINPAVEDLARTRFTFLNDCKGDVSVVLGDARLSLEREMDAGELQSFDVLALDAFSSDAIPVHLLTKEAFELYLMHMAWGGIIAVHTSNRFLSLEPAVYRVAEELGLKVVTVSDNPHTDDWWLYRSTWLLVSRSEETLMAERIVSGSSSSRKSDANVRLWTDDYASIFPLLR
jgi:spermidine synthase